MDVTAYLQRINYHGPPDPTATTLRDLQWAHLLAVPFENLDIHLGRPILLDEVRFFDKIVSRRRGGFCYELNGLFAWLLRELGFDVTLLSARVAAGDGGFGPEFDHLILLVRLEERWLADVGFGDSFRDPLRLDEPGPQGQRQAPGAYQITREGAVWKMLEKDSQGKLVDGYQFTLQPRRLADFADMCRYQQTSPTSHFTQKRICSRATPAGRASLSDLRLIITTNGERHEQELSGPGEYAAKLREYFGIDLSD